MVEIIHQYKKDWSMFTLASLLNKSEDFRLHLYVDEKLWNDAEIKWILKNFNEVRVYQSWWNVNEVAKQVCHFKNYWKDKEGLGKRLIFANGNRLFLRAIEGGNLPPEEFFKKNLSFLSHKKVFKDHPIYKNYYRQLNHPVHENDPEQIDPEFILINWDILKTFDDSDLFYSESRVLARNIDEKINACGTFSFIKKLMTYSYSYMPLYMNGINDWLLKLDALGPKTVSDYNLMLRKAYTLNIQHKWLAEDYSKLPIAIQLGIPWDCYTSLIDSIPLQFRNARLNELLLIKASRQKSVLGSLLKTGFKLGKL